MLTGENGILTQAQNARDNTDKATEEEKIQMAVLGSSVTDNGYADILDATSFENELINQFGNNGYQLVTNGDGSFIITVTDTQRKYYVNDDKTVINSDNIIELGTAEELANLSQDVKNGNTYEGKAILLTSKIDLGGENWTPIGYYPTENSTPDVETNKPFKGIFDGCGYEVDNLYINTTDKGQGLFGLVNNGKVANITVGENSNISGGRATAGIVGYAYNETVIYNCSNEANVTSNNGIIGGVIGIAYENCIIKSCYNSGDVTGKSGGTEGIGGLIGQLYNGSIILESYNDGKVTGNCFVGRSYRY